MSAIEQTAGEPVACQRCAQLNEGMAALASTLDQHDEITLSDYIVHHTETGWHQRIVMRHGDEVYHDVGSVEELLFREALSRRNAKEIAEVVASDMSADEKRERVEKICESEKEPFVAAPSLAHPRPRVGVTEAMVDAYLGVMAERINVHGIPQELRDIIARGIAAALAVAAAPTASGEG